MISTKGRYALRLMIDLAEQPEDSPVPLKQVAERQQISKKYLEIIAKDLVKGGFLTGTSGKGGGYLLTRRPEDYTIFEILEHMEGTLSPVACLKDDAEECPLQCDCRTLPMWDDYYKLISAFFQGNHLSDLVRKKHINS